MPSIAAHMIVASLVSKNLKLNSREFIKGNVYPDIISSFDMHYRKKVRNFDTPDIDEFIKNNDITNKLNLGQLSHLLLDKLFLEQFILKYTQDDSVFLDNSMYKDYDKINSKLINRFNIDKKYLEDCLKELYSDDKIDKEKLKKNISFFMNNAKGNPEIIDEEDFSDFLYNSSEFISNTIRKYI